MTTRDFLWIGFGSCVVGYSVSIGSYGIAAALFSFVVFAALVCIFVAILQGRRK